MDEPRDEARMPPDAPGEGEANAPDDVGPPQPASDSWLGTVGKTMLVVGLGGVAFFAIVSPGMLHTRGAPASVRLKLERRRAEAERAIAEADQALAEADAPSEEEDPSE